MIKKNFWVSLLLLIVTFVVVQGMHIGTDVVVWKKNLDKLPYTIGGMKAVDIPLEESVLKELDPDAYVFRNYVSSDGQLINVYIGYYGTQKGGRSTHNPGACYPGSGWAILNESLTTASVGQEGKKYNIPLNILQVAKGDEKQVVYHWYQTDKDTVTVTGIQQNIHRFKNRLLHNRDDGAFVRVSKDVVDSYPQTKKDIDKFIIQLFPLLIEYWPQEKELEQ